MATRRVSQGLPLNYSNKGDLRRYPAKRTTIPHSHKLPATEGMQWEEAESPTDAAQDVLARIHRHFKRFWKQLERRLYPPAPPHSTDLPEQTLQPNRRSAAQRHGTRSTPPKAKKLRFPPGHPHTQLRQINKSKQHRGDSYAATQSTKQKLWRKRQFLGPNPFGEKTLLQRRGYPVREPKRNPLDIVKARCVKPRPSRRSSTHQQTPTIPPLAALHELSSHGSVQPSQGIG
ncbi:Hypothetical predicted protein [Pelobates cultripes]|uniref:Uncharacterized protein n=1 Tax=Pelobates cultripes TaxID=61616 RepID=A0AAD1RUU6_PELCU|nr:Hypothetical predicted protein [Pelobates cultripes]